MKARPFIFIDEAGNFDFSNTGTAFYLFVGVTARRPMAIHAILDDLRFSVMESGSIKKRFHASEDEWGVRNRVFKIIAKNLDQIKIDSVIIEKNKTHESYRPIEVFYPYNLGQLVRYIAKRHSWRGDDTPIFITDEVPTNKRKKALKDAVKTNLAGMVSDGVRYEAVHHQSMSNYGLQIADYCAWAIFRKWESGDRTFYDRIKPAITSEFDIFREGRLRWY